MPSFDDRGFPLFYEVQGRGGIPLVWIVGMGDSGRGWLSLQVSDLAAQRCNVLFDPRGTGRSGDPKHSFTTRDLAEDVRALMDHLSLERAHVLGSFLGGMVAQELALTDPGRVQSLILVGSYARPDAKRRLLLDLWRREAQHGLTLDIWSRLRLCWTLSDATLEQDELIEAMLRGSGDAGGFDEERLVRQIDACLAHDTTARLPLIQAPTLVVHGEDDILTPPHLARELASGIPDAELVLMVGAGHLCMAELAPRFNRLVERFIRAHD
ncbi:MAG: alpha/beta fold hydrolase [Myxococcota bacterium]